MAGESNLQKQCIKCATNYGLLTRKIHAEGFKGWPDLMVMFHGGHVIWFELKNPNDSGVLSKMQRSQNLAIKNMGGEAYVIQSLEAFFNVITRRLNHPNKKGK